MTSEASGAPPTRRNPLRDALAFPFIGLALVGLLDVIVGLRVAPGLIDGIVEHAVLVLHTSARGMVLAAGLAILFAVMLVVARLLQPARRFVEPGLVIWTVVLGGAFVALNEPLWQGAAISRHELIEAFRWATRIGGPILAFLGLVILRRIHRRVDRGASGVGVRLLGLAALAGIPIVDWVNLTQHRNRYPEVHTQLAAGSVFLGVAAAFLLLQGTRLDAGRSRRSCAVAVGLGVIGILLGGAAMRAGVFPRVRVAERRITAVTNEWNALSTRVLAPFLPAREARNAIDLPPLTDVDEAAVQSYLDGVLVDRRRLSVLWIALDTVRHDHTGFTPVRAADGTVSVYRRNDTTPRLNRLARDGYVFSRAYTTYPTSNFAYSSVLTGLYPRVTPVYQTKYDTDWTFPPGTAVAEVLGANGLATICVNGFNANTARDRTWFGHLQTGFDVYNPNQTVVGFNSREVTDAMIAELVRAGDARFFGFAHYLGPHDPYPDPENGVRFDTGDRTDGYDGDIREADTQIGRLIDAIETLGRRQDTVIMVFSDHGESFGEHGATKHNGGLYEHEIHVPMLILIPGAKGREVQALASIADLVPTTLSLLGIEDPLPRHGRNLLPAMLMRPEDTPARYVLAEHYVARGGERDEPSRALLWGDHKLIETDAFPTPEYQLYDLARDPEELRNLASLPEYDAIETELRARLATELPRLDRWHTDVTGRTFESPRERWLKEFGALHARVFGDDVKDASEAVRELDSRFFFDSYDDVSIETRIWLGDERIEALAHELVALARRTDDRTLTTRLDQIIGQFELPSLAPYLQERLRSGNPTTILMSAISLARIHDPAGQDVLLDALTRPLAHDVFVIAVALGLIGNEAGLPALWIALGVQNYRLLVWTMEALDRLDHPDTAARLRDRVYYAWWKAQRLQETIVEAVAHDVANEDTQQILVSFARSRVQTLRDRALALLGQVMNADELERNLVAYDSFASGMEHLKYGRWDETEDALAAACASATIPYSTLRFFRAQNLRARGDADRAVAVLREIEARAPAERDRVRSRAIIAQVEGGTPPFLRRDEFTLDITPQRPLLIRDKQLRNHVVAVPLHVTNTSPHAMVGGDLLFAPHLHAVLELDDGTTVAPRLPDLACLPENGLVPGESGRVTMTFRIPRVPVKRVLVMAQIPWLYYEHEPKVVATLEIPE